MPVAGLLRKGYDKDKPPLPRVDSSLIADIDLPQLDNPPKKDTSDKQKKERKKPGPKPKAKKEVKVEKEKEEIVKEPPENVDNKKTKKKGRKKKGASEKVEDVAVADKTEVEDVQEKDDKEAVEEIEKEDEKKRKEKAGKGKAGKRGRSPKGKRGKSPKHVPEDEDDDDDDENEVLLKKKRGRKPKKDTSDKTSADKTEKTPKKRGRKSKADKKAMEEKDIEPENGDATINYSEVESSELFGDSKDSMPDQFRTGNTSDTNNGPLLKDFTVELSAAKNETGEKSEVDDEVASRTSRNLDRSEEKRKSDSESSDIGSDFDEDLKPPPAPRPPPMYDSEDGDIESGPENEDFNTSALSNEPLRDFESSREISREISRDFESSREIDDSVKTISEHVHSVDTSTPKDHIHSVGTPASVNPYRNDSVNNEYENPMSHHENPMSQYSNPMSQHENPKSQQDNPMSQHENPMSQHENPLSHQSHHSSVPHTPSHNSVPHTPNTHEYTESRSIEPRSIEPHQAPSVNDRIIKNPVHGQTNEENTDESSMPEVDKDYVGRFFEEIQCNPLAEGHISRMSNIEEPKSQEKNSRSDSGVPSSLNSNQTDSNLQMQSPPTDLSLKRMEMMSPERGPPDYVPRSESAHNRSSERIPGVPPFDSQYPAPNPLEYNPPSVPPPARESILRPTDSTKPASPSNTSANFMQRYAESQRLPTPYDRNLQNLHRIAESQLPPHNSSSPLLRHVPGRDEVFPGATGMAGSMARNPFHASWPGQDVRPTHWGHPTYLQQQPGSSSSSLFGKDAYLPGREFMFDPSRAAERNMFPGLTAPPSHSQRPEIPHDTFQFERFDLGSYFPPSLPVDYTRSAHSASQKSLDERYRQSGSSVSDYRSLPASTTGSDMFGVNSSFNLEKFYSSDKFYSRDPMYHSHNITDNTTNPFLPGMPGQHTMFGHRGFYPQNPSYPFMNMNDKNYPSAASSKLGAHSATPVGQQRDLMSVPRPNMAAGEPQLQDPYRHTVLYNMMNKYF